MNGFCWLRTWRHASFSCSYTPWTSNKTEASAIEKVTPIKRTQKHETPIQNVHASYFELVLAILSFVFIELQHYMDDLSTTGTTGPSFLASFRSLPKMRALSLGSDGVFGSGCFGWWIHIQRFIPTHMGLLKDRGNKPTKNNRFFIRFGCFSYFLLFASHEGFRMGLFAVFCWGFFLCFQSCHSSKQMQLRRVGMPVYLYSAQILP